MCNTIRVETRGLMMNAQKQLQKYERLAEIAHRLGCYKCARKWSIKAEKLEAVINALETIKEIKMEKTKVTTREAATKVKDLFGQGNIWDKKDGETRLYVGKGYLRFAPETANTTQVQTFLKSYDYTDELRAIVKDFNNQFEITISDSNKATGGFSEEALATRYGWSEVLDAQADIAREDWDI